MNPLPPQPDSSVDPERTAVAPEGSDVKQQSLGPGQSSSGGTKAQGKGLDSRPDWFKRFIDLATLLVISLGLYFAWDQAKKLTEGVNTNNRNLNVSMLASISDKTIELDKIFVQNPRMQRYFVGGEAIDKKKPDYDKAQAIAFLMLDYFDQVKTFVDYASQALS